MPHGLHPFTPGFVGPLLAVYEDPDHHGTLWYPSLIRTHGTTYGLHQVLKRPAHLARLALSEEQLPVYVDSLSKIFSFVEQLNAADTAAVEPMAHPLADQVQRLRPDEVLDVDRHEKYQRNASRVEADLYLVPKVIE